MFISIHLKKNTAMEFFKGLPLFTKFTRVFWIFEHSNSIKISDKKKNHEIKINK